MSDNGVAMFFIVMCISKITRALLNKKVKKTQVFDLQISLKEFIDLSDV